MRRRDLPPIAHHGEPPRARRAITEGPIGIAGRVGIPQIEHRGGRIVKADRVYAVAVPVAGHGQPARSRRPVGEGAVGVARGIGVPQVERRRGRVIQSDRVHPVAVPVAHDRQPTGPRLAETEGVRGDPLGRGSSVGQGRMDIEREGRRVGIVAERLVILAVDPAHQEYRARTAENFGPGGHRAVGNRRGLLGNQSAWNVKTDVIRPDARKIPGHRGRRDDELRVERERLIGHPDRVAAAEVEGLADRIEQSRRVGIIRRGGEDPQARIAGRVVGAEEELVADHRQVGRP